ncbi:hypothetical protein HYC85_029434 [Camellia sinensis]|uniref:Uncharacterized protein n=1 Tax=Camellia sinensis TaxID=4442 RepID=A0A7J7FXY9_CAMSI|nr:hypothetical protein HYC85_029434 [Camellia sinensis]
MKSRVVTPVAGSGSVMAGSASFLAGWPAVSIHGRQAIGAILNIDLDLIDEEIIAPPKRPHALPPHLNLIHTLSSTYNPSIYITPAHLPKPEVFILESAYLCMMDAFEPQSSQIPSNTLQAPMAEPTTSELMSMNEHLQRTVADLTFGILAPSSTTSHARNFRSKSSPILGQAVIGMSQPEAISSLGDDMSTMNGLCLDIATKSLDKAEASGKNKVGASIDPYAHLHWAIETLTVKGLNKQQVLTVVANTVDDTFVPHVEGILNQGVSHEKGCRTRNPPFSCNPTPVRDLQTQATPVDPSVNTSKTSGRTFNPLYITLSKALQILIGQGHLKPLDSQTLPDHLPVGHDVAKYYAFN